MAKLKGKQYLSETVSFRISDEAKHQLVSLKAILGFDSEADFSREAFLRGLKVIEQDVSSFEPDIVIIGSKIDKGLELTHAEIAYLAEQSAQAYTIRSDYYNPTYIADNIKAAIKLIKLVEINHPHYIESISSVYPGNSLSAYLERTLLDLPTDKAYKCLPLATDLLNILCSKSECFEVLDIHTLNEALAPFFKSLLIVGKYLYHRKNFIEPGFHFDDYVGFIHQYALLPPEAKGKVDYKTNTLQIEIQAEPDFKLQIRHLKFKWALPFSFAEFLDLRNLLNQIPNEPFAKVDLPRMSLNSINYEDDFRWSTEHFAQEMTLAELEELKGLLNQFGQDFKSFIDAMILQWGDL